MILTNKKEQTRFVRFAIVGIIGAVVDFGTFNLILFLTSAPATIAQAISFTAAVISNFIWNRHWTYPDSRSKSISRQLLQFFVVNLIGLLIRTQLFNWLSEVLKLAFTPLLSTTPISPTWAGNNIALASAIIVVMLWNFIINRYWTYNDVS
jgi:putative flippase GtrA